MGGIIEHTDMHKEVNTEKDEAYSFHAILLSDSDEIFDLWLPRIPEGFFQFSDRPNHRFLNISADNNVWTAVCKKPAFFQNVPIEQSYAIPLADGLMVQVDCGEKTHSLYVESVSRKHMAFHNYFVSANKEILIGSHPGCDICYDNPLVSRNHVTLVYTSRRWELRESGDLCGVYVNGKRCSNCEAIVGDTIQIMGLRIIAGEGFLAVAEGAGRIKINSNNLKNVSENLGGFSWYFQNDSYFLENGFFNRAPRKRFELTFEPIKVEGPPMSMDQKQIPMLLRMGSSMVMGGTAALAGNFTTLISSVVFPFLSSKFTDKQRQEYEKLRLSKYTEYLEEKQKEIEQTCENERIYLNQKFPQIQKILHMVQERTHMWERRPIDNDFLQIRLGTGTQLMSTPVEYPQRRFELEPDDLTEKMYQLVETHHYVQNIPIVLSLLETNICGIQGQQKQIVAYLRQIVLQIAALHSYDEVKMVFLLGEDVLNELDEIRYLPHVWDDQRSIRLIATNEAEAYFVGEYIQDQTMDSEDKDIRKTLKKRPYYLVFATEKKLLDSHEEFKEILQADSNMGVSIISAYEDLPKEVQKIITLESSTRNICTTMSADGGEDVVFSLDDYDLAEGTKAMAIMANTSLKTVAQAQELPKMITFLEMFKTGRVEQLNPLKRWKESNPVKSLAAPVGVGPDGSLFTLDLHEKRQGPHGLVAGMTGSGKSEFIITYILSMAVNYHPDEVAFVLIDYKGGGLAGAFENPQTGVKLPHLVGTITNLDGAAIQRSLMSIESELLRRQKKFNEVKSIVNEGTMDIYAYQKLYRAGKVSEPMPHLFIISDEFAELKQQQPEFMAKLISAARIGRSLGVHLILATQKPTGVVDDQIRSNTKFRVCLRVQERSDSMDMLKRPEAAELTDTGRFYLQVGYNEYFALGQSAWCGAQYEPQDTVVVQRDDALEVLDITGQVLTKAKPKVKKIDSGKKQIVAIVEYLSELAKSHGITSKQLWEPALPKTLDLMQLQEKRKSTDNPMAVTLGLVDDPENLRQFPYVLNFETCGNVLIVGEGGSGKTTLVQNILYLLSKQLSPEDFNFYTLDYSSRMLKLFKPLPHCGAVLQEEDEGSLDEFFKLINSIITERKQLFSKLEVDNFTTARKIQKLPLVLVVIDNLSSLSNSKIGENHSYKLHTYLKDSANYGIHFILSCGHLNEAPSRIRQELSERICFHMKDKYDYSDILSCKVVYEPPELRGRGLIVQDGYPLEWQSAYSEIDWKQVAQHLLNQYGVQVEARHLPVLQEDAEYRDFAAQFRKGRIPLGYSKANGKTIALPLKQFSALSIYFGDKKGVKPITQNILFAAMRESMDIWVIRRKENSCFEQMQHSSVDVFSRITKWYATEKASLDDLRTDLTKRILERNTLLQDYCLEKGITGDAKTIYKETFGYVRENTTPIMLFVENMADFCGALDSLSTLLFDKMFVLAQSRNIYVVGCYEPDDYQRVENRLLYYGFNGEMNMLLFGGRFDKQKVCVMPDTDGMRKELQYNLGVVSYQSRFHPILMPCGSLPVESMDEDEQSIF